MFLRPLAGAALLALVCLAAAAEAGWCPPSRHMCGVRGLPSAVVEGIIEVESGGHPWALHVGIGKGHAWYPATWGEARRLLAVALALTDNVDIGLMQINWRTWGRQLGAQGLSPRDLLAPRLNLWAGCQVLVLALRTRGPFEVRLGRYHSWQAERGRRYARRVLAAARKFAAGGVE